MPATSWSPTARTNCKTAARLNRANPAPPSRPGARAPPPAPILHTPRPRGDLRDESVAAVYSAARCNHTADGGRDSGGTGSLSPVARFRAASGGLPNHSGADVLSRCQPGCDVLFGHRAARTQLRANPRLAADDFDELVWKLRHHSAIQSGLEH